MSYAIVYSSKTGNTQMLAQAIRQALPLEEGVYFGGPDSAALAAERLYVGFWTDKGACDPDTSAFLPQVRGKEVFLFGTAGFGGDEAYFQKVLDRVKANLDPSNTLVGSYMCQGKMPLAVRQRYEQLRLSPGRQAQADQMLDNFDRALSHPSQEDLNRLVKRVMEAKAGQGEQERA